MRNARGLVTAAVALLLVFAPLAVRAQSAPAEALDPVPVQRTEPGWSIGAGIGWGGTLSSPVSMVLVGNSFSMFVARAPEVGASVERRLGGGTWLALGLYGRMESSETTGPVVLGGTTPYPLKTELQEGAVTLGLRQVLTPPGAPIAVSILVTGDAGVATTATDVTVPVRERQTTRVTAVGGHLGVAVERELLDGLSVRIATSLAAASWWRARYDPIGGPATNASGFSGGVRLAPSLELRLAF